MNWIEFAVYTTDEGLEMVYGALMGAGLTQVCVEESADAVQNHLDELAPYWDYADSEALSGRNGPCVKAYIADITENEGLLKGARLAIEELRSMNLIIGSLNMEESLINDEDWANNWKKYYKPIPIGEKLMICPTWELADTDRTIINIDPGMAFGTGEHHSTRLCLEMLETQLSEGGTVLDIGCGSGILAIASLLLGAKSAVLVDVDPVAVEVAKQNAEANGIEEERAAFFAGDILTNAKLRDEIAGKYDVVFANIVADVIIALCPFVKDFLRPGGKFICSGIIAERADEVKAALEKSSFQVMDVKRAGEGALETEWIAILAV